MPIVDVLQVLSSLIQALSWPLIALILMYYFGPTLKNIIRELGRMAEDADTASGQIGAIGINIGYAVQKTKVNALTNAARVQKGLADTESISQRTREEISWDTEKSIAQELAGVSVLWVDDRPENNALEQAALETLEVRVTTSVSTENALEWLQRNDYDIVISDMGRPKSDRAGYELLEEMNEIGLDTPFIIYAGDWRKGFVEETRQRGGFGNTNDPQELLQLIQSAVLYPRQMR